MHKRNVWYLMLICVSINFSSTKCVLNRLPLRKSVLQSRGYPATAHADGESSVMAMMLNRHSLDRGDGVPARLWGWRWCAGPDSLCGGLVIPNIVSHRPPVPGCRIAVTPFLRSFCLPQFQGATAYAVWEPQVTGLVSNRRSYLFVSQLNKQTTK